MNITKSVWFHALSLTLALGLVAATATTSAAEITATPQVELAVPRTTEANVPWIDNRILAIGLGALGGVAIYSMLAGNLGMGMRVARTSLPGLPGAAAIRVGGWGSRWVFSTASGLVGALIGDWIYRNNQQAAH